MDALQQKLVTLQEKVDAIYSLVEHTHQIMLAMLPSASDEARQKVVANVQTEQAHLKEVTAEISAVDIALSAEASAMTHKDILPDTSGWESLPDYNTSEHALSPDLQIRRLTAQVTAAYSRIADLEEQLLAQRQTHPEGSSDVLVESKSASARWHRH